MRYPLPVKGFTGTTRDTWSIRVQKNSSSQGVLIDGSKNVQLRTHANCFDICALKRFAVIRRLVPVELQNMQGYSGQNFFNILSRGINKEPNQGHKGSNGKRNFTSLINGYTARTGFIKDYTNRISSRLLSE